MPTFSSRVLSLGRWLFSMLTPRLSLRTLFVLITLIACGLSYIHRCERQRRAVDEILANRDSAVYYYEPQTQSGRLRTSYYTIFGPIPIDYYQSVERLELPGLPGEAVKLHLLPVFSKLRKLDVEYGPFRRFPYPREPYQENSLPVPSRDWEVLDSLFELEELSVQQRYLNVEVAAQIARMPQLRRLTIFENSYCRTSGIGYGLTPSPEVIRALAKSPSIKAVSLIVDPTSEQVAALAAWPRLRKIRIDGYGWPENLVMEAVRQLAIEEFMLDSSFVVYPKFQDCPHSVSPYKTLEYYRHEFLSVANFEHLLKTPSLKLMCTAFVTQEREQDYLERIPPDWSYRRARLADGRQQLILERQPKP